jgi:dTDP-4-dehydrorhamnose reductase
MNPRILITGGSGLLAVNWASATRESCEVFLGLHRRGVNLSGTDSVWLNIESVDELCINLEKINPKIIIHTAGYTDVELCERNPNEAYFINVTLAANVAKACAKLGIKMVHISTDHLFAGTELFITEEKPVNPRNVYGQTKAMAECKVLEVNSQALVIRTNFFGWGTTYRRSFSDIIINSLRAGKKLTLFKDVNYNPILIETLAMAVHEMLNRNAFGIYHVVGDERISKYEFGLRIAKKFNLNHKNIISGLMSDRTDLVKRPYEMSLSNHKTRNFLNRRLGDVDQYLNRLLFQQNESATKNIHIY